MTTRQISLSLDAEVLRAAKSLASGSLSSFVSGALRREVERQQLLQSLDSWLADDPPTPAEVEQARRILRETFGLTEVEAVERVPDTPARRRPGT